MIGGDDRDDGVLVALLKNRGGEADGVGGVAADRFAQQIFLRQFRKILQHLRAVRRAGADEDPLGRQHAAQAVVAELQQALALHDREKLLGRFAARQRPKPRPRPARHDHAVLHVRSAVRPISDRT